MSEFIVVVKKTEATKAIIENALEAVQFETQCVDEGIRLLAHLRRLKALACECKSLSKLTSYSISFDAYSGIAVCSFEPAQALLPHPQTHPYRLFGAGGPILCLQLRREALHNTPLQRLLDLQCVQHNGHGDEDDRCRGFLKVFFSIQRGRRWLDQRFRLPEDPPPRPICICSSSSCSSDPS